MKQGKLIRRAVSAALAGCMMFTFSAPALAESTDALMQLSMTRRSAVSVLDEENDEDVQDYGLEVGGESTTPTRGTSKNCKDILNKGDLNALRDKAKRLAKTVLGHPNVEVEWQTTKVASKNQRTRQGYRTEGRK